MTDIKPYDIGHELFRLGDWILQKDNLHKQPIASIRHRCSGLPYGQTIWFNTERSITLCYCGARVPDEIQGLCILFNMEWIQEEKLNG